MRITLSKGKPAAVSGDVLAVGVPEGDPAKQAHLQSIDRAMGGALLQYLKDEGFKATRGQTLGMLGRGRLKAKRVLLIGMGTGDPDVATLRLLGVKAGRSAKNRASLAVVAPTSEQEGLSCVADGVMLGAYGFTRYLTGARKPKQELRRVSLVIDADPTAAQRAAVRRGVALGESVNLARDLVNTPPNDLTATELANIAKAQASTLGLQCKVFDKRGIQKLGMPLLLAVNRGSKEEPRFIHVTYKPKRKRVPKVVFVGKGLTFDSGGLCIKPAASMLDMKIDMAGAATTLGVVLAAAQLKLPVEVHALIGSTDNMTGADAYRPGDIFPSRLGKTVEIINTDAEGRLVLADALAYATELKPDYIVDHATLTGACMVALGAYTAGLFSNDEAVCKAYEAAAKRSGESYWQMPLLEQLRDQLKSPIADLKHTGSRYGGSITAALFLREFVGETKWVHLDVAGPAFLERPHDIHPKGGTGFGVLTAIEFLQSLGS